MNIELIPNNADEESPHHVDDGETPVIENIDHIIPINSNAAAAVAVAVLATEEEEDNNEDISAAISDDTSATSIASELSDGISRPRSASLIVSPSSSVDHRPSSIPRMRPRSNPRTRTPMRHESPLLVISPMIVDGAATREGDDVAVTTRNDDVSLQRETIVSTTTDSGGTNNNNDEQLIRNIFNTRNRRTRRLRAGSIPEELEEHHSENEEGIAIIGNNDSVVDPENDAASNQRDDVNATAPLASSTTTTNATRAAGRFFSQAVAPSNSTRRRNTQTQNQTTQSQPQRTLLTKQNPSHRKIRRWRNDAFIGTPSEHVHTMLMMNEGDHTTFPYMPNHPLEYNCEFKKLSGDTSRGGKVVRERFMRGEVASIDFMLKSSSDDEVGGEEEECMSRRIVTRCRQLGISNKLIASGDEFGKGLYEKLGSRIQSILSRSCGDGTSASRIVSDFESYLVSLALNYETVDGDDVEKGYPPLQPQSVYDLFNDILTSPPRIVIRNKRVKKAGKKTTAKEGLVDMNNCGVLIPTIHFYFPTEGQDGSSKRSSAFHRILLYAVCQFHGLETSSNVVSEKKAKRDGKKKKKDGDGKGSVKVVTVQSGVLLAPDMKLLDFVCT